MHAADTTLCWVSCSLLLALVHADGLVQIWPSFCVLSLSVLMNPTGLLLSWARRSTGVFHGVSLNVFSTSSSHWPGVFPWLFLHWSPRPLQSPVAGIHTEGDSEFRWMQAILPSLVINSLKNIFLKEQLICEVLWNFENNFERKKGGIYFVLIPMFSAYDFGNLWFWERHIRGFKTGYLPSTDTSLSLGSYSVTQK